MEVILNVPAGFFYPIMVNLAFILLCGAQLLTRPLSYSRTEKSLPGIKSILVFPLDWLPALTEL